MGSDVVVRFRPADADSGVVFVRTDLSGRPSVRACLDHVVPTPRRTTLRDGAATVEMVEHVMAALAGLRVDNCIVEIDAPEAPGCDGTSAAFAEALLAAGTVEQSRRRATLVIEQPATVRDGKAVIAAYPGSGEGYILSYQLDFGPNNPIGRQGYFVEVTPESFADEIATARTFVLEAEAAALRQAGIGTRATAADLLIFGPDGVIGNTLRFSDECARHKLLDVLGDLALLGMDLVGHVVAHRSGHHLNAALGRALLEAELGRTGTDDDEPGTILHASAPHASAPRIDVVLATEPGVRVSAVTRVGKGESGTTSAFLIEALSQAAALLIKGVEPSRGAVFVTSIDGVRLARAVQPGAQVRLEVTCGGWHRGTARAEAVALSAGRVVAEAVFTFATTTSEAERPAA
jgi:UDP-3-O-acyl N-acetylglucosamine deacetylase